MTYLRPVVPDAAMQADSVLFADAVRSAMAEGMGSDALISDQSYDEFFLWKLGREELGLPSRVLRTLNFKAAAAAVAEGGGSPLTLDSAKAALRAYAAAHQNAVRAESSSCFSSRGTESEPLVAANHDGVHGASERGVYGGVAADGFARALGFESSGDGRAAAAWSAVVAAAGAGGDLDVSLDFQQFLVGLHRARPAPAVGLGWL